MKRTVKVHLFQFRPKSLNIIVYLVVFVLISVFLYTKIGILSKREEVVTPAVTESPTLTPSPTPNIIEELEAAINVTNDPSLVVIVDKIIGNYAKGQIGSPNGAGSGWYAVKTNDKWRKITQGQNMSPNECNSMVQQYNIPKNILECRIVTPQVSDYRFLQINWCPPVGIPNDIVIKTGKTYLEKNCLTTKYTEIKETGLNCIRVASQKINCDVNRNKCRGQGLDNDYCNKNYSCDTLPDYKPLQETFLDLISKYCKDI